MDKTRFDFISHLQAADAYNHLRVYSPVTTLGRTIIVHAKLTIIDDTLLRISSANINNRSMGFDSECDLAIEAQTEAQRARVSDLRIRLLSHWLGCPDTVIRDALAEAKGRYCPALEALREGGYTRLRPIKPGKMNILSGFVAKHHVGDPIGARDAWRPWRRRSALRDRLERAGLNPEQTSLVPER